MKDLLIGDEIYNLEFLMNFQFLMFENLKLKISSEKGFGVIEVLVSLMVITSAVTAVILVVFSNQSLKLDNEVNNVALYRAGEIIGKSQVLSAADFNSVIASSSPPSTNDIFTESLSVSDISPCRKDISSSIDWSVQANRPQNVSLTTSLVSKEEAEALGYDCDISGGPVSEWWHPDTFVSVDFGSLGGDNNGTSATGIDVISSGSRKYVVLSSTHGTAAVNDVWVVDVTDITDGSAPYTASLTGALNTSAGLNDIDIAGGHAFAANNENQNQLHTVDLSDLAVLDGTASVSLPGVNPAGSYPQGRKVFYYDNRLYIGINETAGPEFHVFDVSDPVNPVHLGSLELFHNVHDIVVRGNYAYLATSDNTGEVMVIDISNPGALDDVPYPLNPYHPDNSGMKFNAPGVYDGTSLYLLGNKLYLGRKGTYNDSSIHNFFILDIENPASIVSLGSKYIRRNPNQALGLTAIAVSNKFAFLGTDDSNLEFQVFKVDNPANIQNCSEPGYPGGFPNCGKYNFPAKITDLEYDDNFIFVSVESNDAFRVIFDDVSQY